MNPGRLRELALVFLKLGCVAFGGPAAHIAIFEAECVERRKWLDRQKFLDLMGICNLIPGPNSTELVMHLGYLRGGLSGLIVAGACFILPAAVLTASFSAAYVQWGALPQVGPYLAGIKPVVAALIVLALWKLGRKALKASLDWVVAALAIGLIFVGLSEIQALLICCLSALRLPGKNMDGGDPRDGGDPAPVSSDPPKAALPILATVSAGGGMTVASAPTLVGVGLFFLKVGAVLYGSGYVLIAFLEADLVGRWEWLTQQQLLDAVAIGQMTPGPILTTSTAIGWILLGPAGAVVATIAIFLPGFVFVAVTGPLLERLRGKPAVERFLRAVNAAAVALMAIAAWRITQGACADYATIGFALVAFGVLLKTKLNPIVLIVAGAILGGLLL